MTYDENRDHEQLRENRGQIGLFIDRFQENPRPAAQRQTVFLFPGAMASRLRRANAPYVDGVQEPQEFEYKTIWITWSTIFRNLAPLLTLKQVAQGEFRDRDNQIIIPNDVVDFGGNPYDDFISWCDSKQLDWFIFTWDWRRRLEDAAAFFVSKFLPEFVQIVGNATGADPLNSFSLIGHSSGGMVANLLLRRHFANDARLKRVITVGTPFYGYDGQLHRWTEGEPKLQVFGDKKEIVKTISSFPGCYPYMYPETKAFDAHLNLLAADPNYPIDKYPCTDISTGDPADPYNPAKKVVGNETHLRYPPTGMTGFDLQELKHAKDVVNELISPLPQVDEAKFFNVRGVRTVDDTVKRTTWDWLKPPSFDQEPIESEEDVPGDDTQPAWSTRLATLPANQVRPIVADDIEHMYLMNHVQVLDELGTLLGV